MTTPAWERYTFDKQDAEAAAYERKHQVTLGRLSDWNTTSHDISVPLGMYAEAFGRSLNALTRYPETSRTKALCDELGTGFHKRGVKLGGLYLYGSATQAINMLFFALAKRYAGDRFIFLYPGYFSVKPSAEALGLTQETLFRSVSNHFAVPLDDIEIIRQKYEGKTTGRVRAVMVTEPVYSAGVCQPSDQLRSLVKYCRERELLLIIDGSFSGLVWNTEPHWQDKNLLSLLKFDNVVLVDSLSKKLFFHNTKIGVLYGPIWLIELAREGADWLTGNITGHQQELARSIFTGEYDAALAEICRANIERFETRYQELERLAQGTRYRLLRPDSGYHVMAFRDEGTIGGVDAMQWSRKLFAKGVYAIPGHDFGYRDDDSFCFRVSLAINHDEKHLRAALEQPVG